ncbi:hypothetical protein EJ02DRAFT_470294 [Clathrospora elynae]|uniref:Uncharacterized protein n=1 Tax=Clathrospora elynae TaxID=706981 RepID=A0A6A5S7T6_9PLEO|nr:hypothetical protein EJ02DRAFT_470294 [Clathrospora elynae]
MAAGLQPSSIEAPCSSIMISQLHCGSLPKAGGNTHPVVVSLWLWLFPHLWCLTLMVLSLKSCGYATDNLSQTGSVLILVRAGELLHFYILGHIMFSRNEKKTIRTGKKS